MRFKLWSPHLHEALAKFCSQLFICQFCILFLKAYKIIFCQVKHQKTDLKSTALITKVISTNLEWLRLWLRELSALHKATYLVSGRTFHT